MIVIEKISDGIPMKGVSTKDIFVFIGIKMPILFALIIGFFVYLGSGDNMGVHKVSYLSDVFSALGFMYALFFLSFPLFFLFRTVYMFFFGDNIRRKNMLPLIDREYSRIKKYLVEKYQKPLIYFDMEPFMLYPVKLSWSKVIGYPNFCAFNGCDFFMTNRLGEMVKFNWNDVREWTGGLQTGGMMIGSGNQSLAAQMRNLDQVKANVMASGFFVTIKDTSKPEWQFMTATKALQNKWVEIFRQVNDGTIKLQS